MIVTNSSLCLQWQILHRSCSHHTAAQHKVSSTVPVRLWETHPPLYSGIWMNYLSITLNVKYSMRLWTGQFWGASSLWISLIRRIISPCFAAASTLWAQPVNNFVSAANRFPQNINVCLFYTCKYYWLSCIRTKMETKDVWNLSQWYSVLYRAH